MNLYVIKMRRPAGPGENEGFVVRALDEQTARGLLLRHAEEEGAKTWLDTTKSTAILLASACAAFSFSVISLSMLSK